MMGGVKRTVLSGCSLIDNSVGRADGVVTVVFKKSIVVAKRKQTSLLCVGLGCVVLSLA